MESKVIQWEDIKNDPNAVKVLDHGFVYLKSVYGDDNTVCEAARISYGAGTKSINDNRNLIRYLVRHSHTSPLEQVCATFVLKLPLFVMAQLVRHRTAKLNQYSGRYSEMPDEYFYPKEWRAQSTTNKQGSGEVIEYLPGYYMDVLDLENGHCSSGGLIVEEVCQSEYNQRLEAGVSRELARTCLPQSQYTLTVWQMDLHNLAHFIKLRLDPHAQYEIQVYAQAMYDLLKDKFPLCFEAINDYKLQAKTFSRMEMDILTKIIPYNWCDQSMTAEMEKSGMSKREISEFVAKISKTKTP